MGAEAINQAVKALILTDKYLQDDGIQVACEPEYVDVVIASFSSFRSNNGALEFQKTHRVSMIRCIYGGLSGHGIRFFLSYKTILRLSI